MNTSISPFCQYYVKVVCLIFEMFQAMVQTRYSVPAFTEPALSGDNGNGPPFKLEDLEKVKMYPELKHYRSDTILLLLNYFCFLNHTFYLTCALTVQFCSISKEILD